MKRALVLGGSGFIGMSLIKRLKAEGYWVRSVDIRESPFGKSPADSFAEYDLRGPLAKRICTHNDVPYDEVYQLACDMGGAGYIFTGQHDAEVIRNNVLINTYVADAFSKYGCGRLLYTSSSCVYNDAFHGDGRQPPILEEMAGWSPPSNSYGWEKLFSEEIYLAHKRNYGLNVCITRFSTIYGPGCCFDDGREKAVAAICRKVLDAPHGGEVEVWGDGQQIRPLVYIEDLLDAMTALVRSDTFSGPVNIANNELTTCDEVAEAAIARSNKVLSIKHVPGPTGKQVLTMDTVAAAHHLGWVAKTPFFTGLGHTFDWIASQKTRQELAA
jgi:nucleoside-diphosphate-sugar epimerase